MWAVAVMLLGGLVVLAGLSVYSALMISKRTDEIVTSYDDEEQSPVMVVHFPESVFRTSEAGK